jgi:holin-like protein
VPGSVLGMLALTVLIETGVVPMRLVQGAGDLLVRHLALFYVPAGAAVLAHVAVVRREIVPITVAALASLVTVLVVVGVMLQRLGRDE